MSVPACSVRFRFGDHSRCKTGKPCLGLSTSLEKVDAKWDAFDAEWSRFERGEGPEPAWPGEGSPPWKPDSASAVSSTVRPTATSAKPTAAASADAVAAGRAAASAFVGRKLLGMGGAVAAQVTSAEMAEAERRFRLLGECAASRYLSGVRSEAERRAGVAQQRQDVSDHEDEMSGFRQRWGLDPPATVEAATDHEGEMSDFRKRWGLA